MSLPLHKSLTSPKGMNCSALCVPTCIRVLITFHYSYLLSCQISLASQVVQRKDYGSIHVSSEVCHIVGPQQLFI